MAYVHLVRFSLKCFFRCGYELSSVDSLLHTQRLAIDVLELKWIIRVRLTVGRS